jgi:hypothetical protein
LTRLSRQIQSLLLVLLMSTALLGVQLIQGSSLHVHEQHSVDCALCHFQLSDDSEIVHTVTVPAQFSTLAPSWPQIFRVTTRTIRPYLSRAPPSLAC